jgi:hypothetical protein
VIDEPNRRHERKSDKNWKRTKWEISPVLLKTRKLKTSGYALYRKLKIKVNFDF